MTGKQYLKDEFGWRAGRRKGVTVHERTVTRMRKTMQTFHELLTQGIQLLMNAGIEEARLDAWLLLEYTADISRAWYYAHPESEVNEEIVSEYLSLCQKRAEHIPLQHLTHQACFMGYDFYVDERVLVPRQDTEVLAEEALHQLRNMRNPRILDMCTGSGCLLLSLLMELPDATGTGVDISAAALAVAERNRKNLELEKRAVLVQSDTFSGDYFQKNSGNISLEYDMLISNPPYIPTEDIGKLMEEVRFHDPVLALDGREDGLYFYRRITEQAGKYLKPGGWLMYEIGCEQGADVSAIMQGEGFTEVTVKKDLAGLDRVVIAKETNAGGTACLINWTTC